MIVSNNLTMIAICIRIDNQRSKTADTQKSPTTHISSLAERFRLHAKKGV